MLSNKVKFKTSLYNITKRAEVNDTFTFDQSTILGCEKASLRLVNNTDLFCLEFGGQMVDEDGDICGVCEKYIIRDG